MLAAGHRRGGTRRFAETSAGEASVRRSWLKHASVPRDIFKRSHAGIRRAPEIDAKGTGMELERLAESFGYPHDGQHIVLQFPLRPPGGSAKHPSARGGKLTVSPTGYVAGMLLDQYDATPFGTMGGIERLAVFSMEDSELERLAQVARDALAMRREFRAAR